MTSILALAFVWLLLATGVALVIGRAIRLADGRSSGNGGLDRLLVDARPRAFPIGAARAGFDPAARTV